MSYCNGVPKIVGELLRLTRNTQRSEVEFDEFRRILDCLLDLPLSKSPPEFEQLLMYAITNKNVYTNSEDNVIPNTNNWRIKDAILQGCCYLESFQGHLHIT